MYNTTTGVTFTINDDGSITRAGNFDKKSNINVDSSEKPMILKMYLSQDSMECGEQVDFLWDIANGKENVLTISQSGYETSCEIPDSGAITITSDILSDNINITIESSNEIGKVYARKILMVSKRKNEVSGSMAVTIFYLIVGLFILLGIIAKFF